MAWRNWSAIVVLLLANYLVFSTLATFVFPPTPVTAPVHAVQATFTPGALELRAVGTLSYDFLNPTVTATLSPTPTLTIPATGAPRATTAPTKAP